MVAVPFNRLQAKFTECCNTGCWLWFGSTNVHGYGEIRFNGKLHRVHRIMYEIYKHKIPDNLCIDHLCRNRHCVNPEHLECVSLQENIKRGEAGINSRSKVHCPKGHPYDMFDNRKIRCCSICREAARIKYRGKLNASKNK